MNFSKTGTKTLTFGSKSDLLQIYIYIERERGRDRQRDRETEKQRKEQKQRNRNRKIGRYTKGQNRRRKTERLNCFFLHESVKHESPRLILFSLFYSTFWKIGMKNNDEMRHKRIKRKKMQKNFLFEKKGIMTRFFVT